MNNVVNFCDILKFSILNENPFSASLTMQNVCEYIHTLLILSVGATYRLKPVIGQKNFRDIVLSQVEFAKTYCNFKGLNYISESFKEERNFIERVIPIIPEYKSKVMPVNMYENAKDVLLSYSVVEVMTPDKFKKILKDLSMKSRIEVAKRCMPYILILHKRNASRARLFINMLLESRIPSYKLIEIVNDLNNASGRDVIQFIISRDNTITETLLSSRHDMPYEIADLILEYANVGQYDNVLDEDEKWDATPVKQTPTDKIRKKSR